MLASKLRLAPHSMLEPDEGGQSVRDCVQSPGFQSDTTSTNAYPALLCIPGTWSRMAQRTTSCCRNVSNVQVLQLPTAGQSVCPLDSLLSPPVPCWPASAHGSYFSHGHARQNMC
jgi:hypothetical protein